MAGGGVRRFWTFTALGHLLLVGAALAIMAFVRRSAWAALIVFAPKALLALPSLVIVPALLLKGPRRWLLVQALALALVIGPLMGFHVRWPYPARSSVRLLTWNVWFGAGDSAAIDASVREAKADIVLFQAAASGPDSALRRLEGFHYLHEDQFALASRWPVRVTGKGTLVSAQLHRPWVRFAIDSPIGVLEVISVHPHSPRGVLLPRRGGLSQVLRAGPFADPGGTLAFLAQQLAEIDSAARSASPLLVVAGDFNAPERSALLRGLFSGMEDAFDVAGNGFGYTFPVHRPWVPWLRLDRILYGPALRAVHAEVTGRRGSDHAAVVVDFALR